MKFTTTENKKQLKNRMESAKTAERAKRLKMAVSCKGDEVEIVVCRRGTAPQYAFFGTISEGEECAVKGEIALVGKPWRWYDYFFTVLSCVIFLPLTAFLFAGDLVMTAYLAAGNPLWSGSFCFPFTSAKSREKKLVAFMENTLLLKRTD